MSRLLLLAAFVGTASALTCYTCDSFLTCEAPRVEHCANSMLCYTLRDPNHQVREKGCAAACGFLPHASQFQCTTCSTSNCNSLGDLAGSKAQLAPVAPIYNNQKNRRSIGHGAGVQQPQIGQGVSGHNSGYSAYGNGGGIGNGAGVEHHHKKHEIGHGAQAGHGIGGGAAPNKHHHNRNRRSGSGVGIGDGVRPTSSASTSLAFVPFSLAIARLFQ